MRIAVVGAGAIGGLLAARLANSGVDITVVDIGDHLAAIRSHGLKVIHPEGAEEMATVRAVATCGEAGQQDAVFLSVKATQIAALAPAMRAMFNDETVVVTTQNGLPWWYFQNFDGPHRGHRLRTADPDGIIEANIEPARIIGCVVYPAGVVVAPGVIRHVEGDRFPLGTLDGQPSARTAQISDALVKAGFKAPILDDIRSEIWLKLWGNMSFNPISALTHATLAAICREPSTRSLAADMMREAAVIAEKLGVTFRVSLEKRIAGAERVGEHKTSTLQDVEAGRMIEIDALIGSVVELGRLTGVATPSIDAVYALLQLLQKTLLEQHAKCVLLPVAQSLSAASP